MTRPVSESPEPLGRPARRPTSRRQAEFASISCKRSTAPFVCARQTAGETRTSARQPRNCRIAVLSDSAGWRREVGRQARQGGWAELPCFAGLSAQLRSTNSYKPIAVPFVGVGGQAALSDMCRKAQDATSDVFASAQRQAAFAGSLLTAKCCVRRARSARVRLIRGWRRIAAATSPCRKGNLVRRARNGSVEPSLPIPSFARHQSSDPASCFRSTTHHSMPPRSQPSRIGLEALAPAAPSVCRPSLTAARRGRLSEPVGRVERMGSAGGTIKRMGMGAPRRRSARTCEQLHKLSHRLHSWISWFYSNRLSAEYHSI